MKTSPTQRSLAKLRKEGYEADVVERYNCFTRKRHDLFNFGDIFAFHSDDRIFLIVQTTSASNQSSRLRKILDSDIARQWILSGGEIEVHGWRKVKKTGRWVCNVRPVTLKDFTQ